MTTEAPQAFIDVNTATRQQLMAFAKTELGLSLDSSITKDAARELVAKQLGQKVIAPPPVTGEAVQTPVMEKNLRNLREQKKVTIRIADDPSYPYRVPVSVNGVDYTMRKGVWVDVPESVVEVLRNAVKDVITQTEVDGKIITTLQKQHQFMFEVKP